MAKLTLTPLVSAYQAVPALNANNDLIEAAIENTISRDGTSPNQMNAVFDMNSNRIINLGDAIGGTDAVTLQQVVDLVAALVDFDSGQGLLPASIVSIVDLGGLYTAIEVEGALQEVMTAVLALSQPIGASMVGIDDLAGNYVATDVEAALAEIITIFASTSAPSGASKVGIEDAGGFYSASNVEAALAEVKTVLASTGGAATVGSLDTGGFYTGTDVEAILQEIGTSIAAGVGGTRRGVLATHTNNFPAPNTGGTNPFPQSPAAHPFNKTVFESEAGMHNPSSNNTRLIVPTGVSAVRMTFGCEWDTDPGGRRHMQIRKNGGTGGVDPGMANFKPFSTFEVAGNGGPKGSQIITPIISVSPGDFFECFLETQAAQSDPTNTIANQSWFEMEIIE